MTEETMTDPFVDANGRPRVLSGVCLYGASPRFAELAGRMGFDVVWIDLEHATAGLATAEALCVATEAGGAIPLVRTWGFQRDHMLRALEIGGRIVVVPMVNDADAAREVVRYGKYRPLGERGFYRFSRGLRFGRDPEWRSRADATTVLLPQVETVEAVKNLDAILGVEGVGGVFIGPGDLSADMGKPGQFDDAELVDTICACIRRARDAGLHAGVLTPAASLIDKVVAAGADLCVFASDISPIMAAWEDQLASFRKLCPQG